MDYFDDAFFDKVFHVGFGVAGFMVVMGIISFAAIFIGVVVVIVKNGKKNNNSPCLTVPARIVSKRARYSQYGSTDRLNTWYYVTFQVESGDRMEFCVGTYEYGLLIEGDTGKLTFQGTRYISFDRN